MSLTGHGLHGNDVPQTVGVGYHTVSVSHGSPLHRTHCRTPRIPIHSNYRQLGIERLQIKKICIIIQTKLSILSIFLSYKFLYCLITWTRSLVTDVGSHRWTWARGTTMKWGRVVTNSLPGSLPFSTRYTARLPWQPVTPISIN